MDKNIIVELLKEVNELFDKSNELDSEAEKNLTNGNESEWEEAKIESVEKSAYARGIRYALEKLGLVAKME